jgi:hypothetical protein
MRAHPANIPLTSTTQSPVWMGTGVKGDTVTFINYDPIYPVYLGYTNAITIGGLNTIPLLPNGPGIALPGDRSIFAVSNAATPLVVVPGSIQYAPITTGIASALISATLFAGFILNTSSSSGTSPFPVSNFSSYNISVAAHCASQGIAGAPYTLPVTLTWYDAPNGNLLGRETWEVWVSNATPVTNSIARGAGPMLGPYMTISLLNPSSTASITIDQLSIDGNMRPIVQSDWRQAVPPLTAQAATTIVGNAPASYQGESVYENIAAAIINQALAVSTLFWVPMPLFAGKFIARYNQNIASGNTPVLTQAARLTNGGIVAGTGAPGIIWNVGNAVGEAPATNVPAPLIAPKAPLVLIVNTSAVAGQSISFTAEILGKTA